MIAVALAAGAIACRGSRDTTRRPPANTNTAPAPAEPAVAQPASAVVSPEEAKLLEHYTKFDHNRAEHKKQDCAVCHQRTNNDAAPTLPYHTACNLCHISEYTSTSSQLCVVCHQTPIAPQPKAIAFPARFRQFTLKGFSHKQHMDPAKMEAGVAAPKCDSCHRFDARGLEASLPRHAECYSCHTHQPGQKLAGCQICHADQSAGLKYHKGTGSAFALYNFKHGSHFKQASIQLKCDKCHRVLEQSPGKVAADIEQINTNRGQRHNSACWSCHQRARETVCTKCHLGGSPL